MEKPSIYKDKELNTAKPDSHISFTAMQLHQITMISTGMVRKSSPSTRKHSFSSKSLSSKKKSTHQVSVYVFNKP